MNIHTRDEKHRSFAGLPGVSGTEQATLVGAPIKGFSTRAYLALLALGLSIPLMFFSSYLVWREARAERTRYMMELAQTANQLSFVLDREFSFLVTLLEGLASSPAMLAGDFARVHEQARNLRGLPDVNISMRTAEGKMLLNARAEFGAPQVDISVVLDHDAELLREKRPVMSNLFAGVTRGGFASFSAAIPVLQNGEVAYILQANLPTSHFASLMREFRLSNDATAFIIDKNNTFVALSRDTGALSGKKYAYSAQPPQTDGDLRGYSADGALILGVIATSKATGWRVGVTATEATVQAPTNRALRDLAALGLLCAAIGLLFAFTIGRKIAASIQRLALAGEGLRRNEVQEFTATPLREVNDVARLLADTSRRLEKNEARIRESEAWLQDALRAGRAFALDFDVAGDTMSFSGAGAEILGFSGLRPAQISGRAFRTRIHADDYAATLASARNLRPASPALVVRFRYVHADGEILWLGLRATARFDSYGRLIHIAGLGVDMTAQTRAEEAQARLAAIVETSPDMIISVAPGGAILTWNAGAERMFGYTADEVVGRSLRMLIPNEHDDLADLVRMMDEKGSIRSETIRIAKDGRRIHVRISAASVKLPDGTRGSSAIFTDITEQKKFEESQRTLINELNHRVKNTLATIQSIAAHTFRDRQHRVTLDTFVSRLIALSQAHNVLTQSNWEGANLADIVVIAIGPHQTRQATRFRCSGPGLRLNPRAALALSMALHELCTNAAKYGALSNADGVVSINWGVNRAGNDQRLELLWAETGGPPVTAPTHAGFGTRLVQAALADDLEADVQLDFETTGLTCRVNAPLAASAATGMQVLQAPTGIDA